MGTNGDQPDVEENFPWSCWCGTGGAAASQAEANSALTIHQGIAHRDDDD